jgi:hypothetical protein
MNQHTITIPSTISWSSPASSRGVGKIGTSILTQSSSENRYHNYRYDVWSQFSKDGEVKKIQLRHNPIAVIMYLKTCGTMMNNYNYSKKDFLEAEPTPHQIQHAEEITDYYLNKLLCQRLSNQYKDTDYKAALSNALTLVKSNVIAGDHVRLLYKLIDFYVEDIQIEELCKQFKSLKLKFDLKTVGVHKLDLNFVKKISVSRQSKKVVEYFFSDSDRHLYCLRTRMGDAIEPFLNLAVSNGPIRVSCITPHVETFLDYDFGYAVLNIKEIHTL